MKLYGALASPFVARVVLFARLKGITLTPQMPEGGIKSPEYLARNPMGKMPVLDVDGAVLPESEVICEYLEDLHPGSGGLPGDALARARARLVSRVHDLYVYPPSGVLFRNLNPATRDATAVANAKTALETGFAQLEHFVSADPYAAGGQLSLADCALLPSLAVMRKTVFPAFAFGDPTTGTGTLGRWWKTVEADPVTGPFLADYNAAVDGFLKMLAKR